MTTIKLKKPAVPRPAGDPRPPVRGSGARRPRPTLAEAEAERARRRAEQAPASTAPRSEDRPPAPRRNPSRPGDPTARPPRRDPRAERPAGDRAPHPPRDAGPPRRNDAPSAARGTPPARATPVPPPRPRAPKPVAAPDALPRLSKRMSELGLASRREADEWIEQGFVRVDGELVDQLGARVRPEQAITIDPQARLQQAQRVTVLLHKPLGYVSGQAEDGHAPAFTLVGAATRWAGDASPQRFNASQLKHLVPAGRLDLDSTGLLVLTQDGRIAKQLIGEDSLVEKEYVVKVAWTTQPELVALHQAFPPDLLARLRHGLQLDGVALKPAQVSWQSEQHLRVVLREGRKRQIRRMCELVGLQVLALKRIRIGRVKLGELPEGQWRYLGAFEKF